MIIIKSKREIELMREPCKVTAELLDDLAGFIRPGISTMDISEFVEKRITGHGMTPTFKGYGGFPAAACVSVNEEVIHGIPNAARKLRDSGLDKVIIDEAAKGKPLLGICLGMQMLFDKSYEYGEHKGLGLISGSVKPIRPEIPEELKIPHIGWNPLIIKGERDELFKYINEGDCVYFVHSYYAADCDKHVIATAEYGKELTAAVRCGNVCGAQFHPEKSGKVGLAILKAFCEI